MRHFTRILRSNSIIAHIGDGILIFSCLLFILFEKNLLYKGNMGCQISKRGIQNLIIQRSEAKLIYKFLPAKNLCAYQEIFHSIITSHYYTFFLLMSKKNVQLKKGCCCLVTHHCCLTCVGSLKALNNVTALSP